LGLHLRDGLPFDERRETTDVQDRDAVGTLRAMSGGYEIPITTANELPGAVVRENLGVASAPAGERRRARMP
jgi:hypothetical protein